MGQYPAGLSGGGPRAFWVAGKARFASICHKSLLQVICPADRHPVAAGSGFVKWAKRFFVLKVKFLHIVFV